MAINKTSLWSVYVRLNYCTLQFAAVAKISGSTEDFWEYYYSPAATLAQGKQQQILLWSVYVRLIYCTLQPAAVAKIRGSTEDFW